MDARLAIDSTVLLLYFVLIMTVGLYMGRKEENLKDFALGGRRMPWWAVLASLIAAETTAATYFGAPGEGFTFRNYTYLQLALGTILARILVSYIFIKPYYDYQSLLHLRIPYCPVRRAHEKCGVGGVYDYAIACLRCALVFRRHRLGARLPND
jgi:hypothetical protein